jgi:hypothetical protein
MMLYKFQHIPCLMALGNLDLIIDIGHPRRFPCPPEKNYINVKRSQSHLKRSRSPAK